MKNLTLLSCKPSGKIPNCSNACLAIDVDTSTVYVVSSTHFIGFSPETGKVLVEVSLVTIGFAPENGGGSIIGVQHLPELEAVCFATAKGDVNLYNTAVEQFECVGSVDSGLTCMSWSPDQEMVAFTTGEEKIIIMNKDFDPITEVSMKSKLLNEDGPVNVGWGKKETQFHGSLGKNAAKASNKVDSNLSVVEDDDDKPRISWRGDGQFFVVSSVTSQGIRELRVWSRDGCLVSTGESVSGLGSVLDWRPSGNLIASTQRLPNKHQLIFFEKNGLRHGEFALCHVQTKKVIRLMWNIDSTVLAVWIEDVGDNYYQKKHQDNQTSHNYVQLWYCSNYHWFLKQELDLSVFSPDDALSDMCWDTECSLKLHLLTKGGCYTSYRFCWEITQTPGHSSENHATVVMIDGANLLLTPLASVVIPPPMSAHSCQTHSPINGVAFHPSRDDIALLLSDGTLAILKSTMQVKDGGNDTADNETRAYLSTERVNLRVSEELWTGPGSLHQLTWWKHGSLIAIGRNVKDGINVLCEIHLTECDGQYEANVSNILPVEKDILRLSANVDTGSLAVECTDGTMLRCKSESDEVEIVPWTTKDGLSLVMPQPCIYIQTVEIGEEEVVIGLTEHSRLYMNEKEVANNCSSFFIHDEFLLLTTTAHMLRSTSILPNKKGLWSLLQGNQIEDNVRSIERGSKIITAVTQDTKVILQMPRGNLETIHPRILIVSYLKKCLDSLKYKDAFICMKRHRINLNLIYDHNPKLFLDNVETFIRQVESVVFLNLFLSDVKEEDVTLTLYLEHYRDRDPVENSEKEIFKVDAICDAMRLALGAIDRSKYLLCVLTSHVKKTKPELETALTVVKHLKDSNDVTAANDALKYVLFLVDVHKMYDVALGMYDFQLVLMVAEKSQKDPKEYLPFLNNLRKMDINYQKYSIDKYLKRYTKAIVHLTKCGAERFEECLELIKDQSLYTEALPLYSATSSEYKTISECYGEYLMAKKKYDEAGLVLARCESCERALEAFQKSGNWRQVFCMAVKLALSQERIMKLSRSLAGYLREHDRHGEAAIVLLDYANDYEEAIESLIQGKLWEESIRLMYKFERTDIIETHFKPALQESCIEYVSSLEAKKSQFEKYKNRLKVVREDKEKKKMDFMDNEFHDEPDAELFSETSSMTGQSTITASSLSSRTSRSTGKSSKNRKKAKRKKVRLKEGSPFEDFALMEELSEITSFVDQMQEEISMLLKMLVLFAYDANARDLQQAYGGTLHLVRSSLTEIWPTKPEETNSPTFGPGSTSNTIVSAMKGNERIQNKDTPVAPTTPVLRKLLAWRLDQLS